MGAASSLQNMHIVSPLHGAYTDQICDLMFHCFRVRNANMRRYVQQARWLLAADKNTKELFGALSIDDNGVITNVCTSTKWRNRGVSTKLLRQAVRLVRHRGQDASLWVDLDNPDAKKLVRFYEGLGFGKTRVRERQQWLTFSGTRL
jgi:ribosomal protein S18 acetylase RimI-like enzyme